jgi:hypothetical protein
MTSAKRYNIPYMATEPAAASLSRDTYFSWVAHAFTNEYIDVAVPYVANTTIDLADLGQCSYESQMMWADTFGKQLSEQVESAVLADYTNWTDFDNGIVTADVEDNTNIDVTDNNVDNIIGAMKREIMQARGWDLASRNGMFIMWTSVDFEKLEAWARASGYTSADEIIVNGAKIGMRYLGVEHYVSQKHTSLSGYHVMGGVKKLHKVGLLNTTYGKVDLVPFPVSTGNLYSIGVASRIDYGVKTPTNYAGLLFDMQVNA